MRLPKASDIVLNGHCRPDLVLLPAGYEYLLFQGAKIRIQRGEQTRADAALLKSWTYWKECGLQGLKATIWYLLLDVPCIETKHVHVSYLFSSVSSRARLVGQKIRQGTGADSCVSPFAFKMLWNLISSHEYLAKLARLYDVEEGVKDHLPNNHPLFSGENSSSTVTKILADCFLVYLGLIRLSIKRGTLTEPDWERFVAGLFTSEVAPGVNQFIRFLQEGDQHAMQVDDPV